MPTTNQYFWPDYLYTAHDQTFGINVDKMNLAAPGSGQWSDTSEASFGTSGTKSIVYYPNSLSTVVWDDTSHKNYGFAVDNADMGSTAQAERLIKAGTWTIEGEVGCDAAALNDVTMIFRVLRVGAAPGLARTTLFDFPLIYMGLLSGAYSSFSQQKTGVPEIILGAGETLMLVCGCYATGQLGGLIVTLKVGKGGAAADPRDLRLGLPAPLATISRGDGSSAGSGAASGTGASTRSAAGSATGVGTASGQGASTWQAAGSSSGAGAATANSQKIINAVGSGSGSGTVSGVGASTWQAAGSSSGAGAASGTGASTWSAAGSATGVGTASGQGGKVLGAIGTCDIGGGGGTTVKKPIYLFED